VLEQPLIFLFRHCSLPALNPQTRGFPLALHATICLHLLPLLDTSARTPTFCMDDSMQVIRTDVISSHFFTNDSHFLCEQPPYLASPGAIPYLTQSLSLHTASLRVVAHFSGQFQLAARMIPDFFASDLHFLDGRFPYSAVWVRMPSFLSRSLKPISSTPCGDPQKFRVVVSFRIPADSALALKVKSKLIITTLSILMNSR